jgi:hypothetical protein
MKNTKTIIAILETDGHTVQYLVAEHTQTVQKQSFINCFTAIADTPEQARSCFDLYKSKGFYKYSETLILQALLDEQKYLDATLICYKMDNQKWYIRENKPQAGTNLVGVEMRGAELVELHDVVAQLKQKQIA